MDQPNMSTGLDRAEIGRRHGETLVRSLRIAYGKDFAPGCDDAATVAEVLEKIDEASLAKLAEDDRRDNAA